MNTSTPRVLSGSEVRALSQRSDWHGTVQTGFHFGLVVATGWWVAVAGPWTIGPAILALGLAQATLFAPVHETMHLTAFRNRRANAIVGWIAAAPSMLNWHFYAVFHLAHHRFTQDPARDPELTPLPPSRLDSYLLRILGVNYWRARAAVLRDCWLGNLAGYPFIPAPARPRVVTSVRWMSAMILALAGVSAVLAGWWAPFAFWIAPQLLGQPFLRLYLLTEHTGCSEDGNGLTNTRTTLTNRAVRLVMWNMSFHTEHHLYPSIPFHRLPDTHRAARDRLGVVQDGYARWHLRFLRKIVSQA